MSKTNTPTPADPPGQPIPDEILHAATPDMLQLMAYACHLAGNEYGKLQVVSQQMIRAGLVSWPYAEPDEVERRRRRGRRRRRKKLPPGAADGSDPDPRRC